MAIPERIGRYEVAERVGRGGMGVLYRARDTVLDREVAIKVMSADFAADENASTRFFREARAAARLQHRNIVTIFEFGEEDGLPFIVMEFLRGKSLAARMREQPPMACAQALDVIVQLCTGLQFAHEQGVVHRDVKPANVWLLDDGTIKLLDFGIARVASSTLTHGRDVMGSAAYMAPEQIAGKLVDGRADVFSAGVVLYELLSGRKPFDGDSPTAVLMSIVNDDPPPISTLVPDCDPALAAVVQRALSKQPDGRFASASDFGAELNLIRLSMLTTAETLVGVRPGTLTAAPAPIRAERREPLPARPNPALEWARRRAQELRASASAIDWRWRAPVPLTLVAIGVLLTTVLVARALNRGPAELVSTAVEKASTGVQARSEAPPGKVGGDAAVAPVAEPPPPAEAPPASVPVEVSVTGGFPFELVEGKRVVSPEASAHKVTVKAPTVLRMRAPQYFLDAPVRVDAGPKRRLDIQAPGLGQLTIRATQETCKVSLGGRDLGFPPIVNQPVAAGSYEVALTCPNGQTRKLRTSVTAGETKVEVMR